MLGGGGLGAQPALDGDQGVRHQPVDLVPGGRDLGGDGLAEHLHDGGEQVLVDDPVLVVADADRDVLVRDAGEQRVRTGVRGGDQGGREGGYRARERLPLAAVGLVAPVEQVAQQLRVGGEHPVVEQRRDVADRATHDGQGGFDDLGGLGGKHRRRSKLESESRIFARADARTGVGWCRGCGGGAVRWGGPVGAGVSRRGRLPGRVLCRGPAGW